MARNRWRGLLRYGALRAWRLKRRMKRDTTPPEYYLAVRHRQKRSTFISKNGLNGTASRSREILHLRQRKHRRNPPRACSPTLRRLVDYTYFPGQKMQLLAYDDCFERHRLEARWIAVIDLDEFIVPVKDPPTSLPSLRRMENFSAVEINWLVYGSGGAKNKEPGRSHGTIPAAFLPGHRLNTHVKSIADPRRAQPMTGCHEAARLSDMQPTRTACR